MRSKRNTWELNLFLTKKNSLLFHYISLAATHGSENALLLRSMNIKRDGFCSQNFNRFFCRCQVHVKEMCSGMSFELRSFEACEELFSFIFPLSGNTSCSSAANPEKRRIGKQREPCFLGKNEDFVAAGL